MTNATAYDEIQLYHYRTRSVEEFRQKQARGSLRREEDYVLTQMDGQSTENCTEALRYLPEE